MAENKVPVDSVTMTKANYLEFLNRVFEAGKIVYQKRQAEIDAFVNNEEAVMADIISAVKTRLISEGIDIVRTERYEAKYGPLKPWWGFGYIVRKMNWRMVDSIVVTEEQAIAAALKVKGLTLEEAVSSFITSHRSDGYGLATVLSNFYNHGYWKLTNGVGNRLQSLPSVPNLIKSVEQCNDANFTLAMDTYNKYTQLLIEAEKK